MSKGIGVKAKLILQDDKTVIYEYGSYNWNEENYRNIEQVCDGMVSIQKTCFLKPEIHEKIKRFPNSKKKLITKKIPVDVDYLKAIDEGLIIIENCSNCGEATDDEKQLDVMVLHILCYLFLRYQEEGNIPEYIGYYV